MNMKLVADHGFELTVENIGGIQHTEFSFSPGVTLLVGENATNRTSLLQAIMAGLGSDQVSIRADAEQGHVTLRTGDQTYERTLTARNGAVVAEGEGLLNDPTEAELFAFLLESNQARRVVALDSDLREVIMQPIDTDAIQADINRLREEKQEIEARLEQLEECKQRLPQLEAERRELQSEIDELRTNLEQKEEQIDAADADLEERREEQVNLEEKLATLRETRSELEDVRYKLDTRRESLENLQQERASLRSEHDDLPEVSNEQLDSIESELQGLRSRQDTVETELSRLQSLVQFNEEMLNDGDENLLDELNGTSETVTDRLMSEERVCWTCGTQVDASQVEATVDQLRNLREKRIQESNEIDQQLEELITQRDELREQQQHRTSIETRLDVIDSELNETKTRIADLEDRRDELSKEVTTLEQEVEEAQQDEQDDYSEIVKLHKEANELEFKIERHEAEFEDLNERVTDLEARLEAESELEQELIDVETELEERRTRIERIEQNAIEAFNKHMEAVLGLLNYANLERIWIERTEREVREGRRTATRSAFELHVIRSTPSGTVYEDTIDHLSESEREVTGLVFALAGYIAHEIYRNSSVMLLDSVEAIDSSRLAALVEYLQEYAEYLIIALLPEDAAALDDSYTRVTDI